MSNEFSKEERVAFEDQIMAFEDELVLSKQVSKYETDSNQMENSNDTIWRPVPYIANSFNSVAGTTIASDITDIGQLSVPATISINKTVAWQMNARELRSSLRNERFGVAARQRLASDVNGSIMDVAAEQGTLVVTKTGGVAASSFADVALLEAVMNEQGVPMGDRSFAMSTRDYNGIAADLAGRGTLQQPKTLTAYEKAYIGEVAGFSTFKLDYANNITAEASTTVTMSAASQYHTPLSAQSTTAGEVNVDNRTQIISIAVTSGTVAVGDCFTIAGVNSVHHIKKTDTGELKTFRIRSIVTGSGGTGTIEISPPIISNGGSTDIEAQYQNVTATPANGAALVFLNTVTKKANPFWHKDAFEILPGRLSIEDDAGVGVIRGTTENGIELVLQKQWDILTNKAIYRMDILYGVVCCNPEMAGIALFEQT